MVSFFAEECSQSRDHIRRTVAVANRSPGGFSRTVDIWSSIASIRRQVLALVTIPESGWFHLVRD